MKQEPTSTVVDWLPGAVRYAEDWLGFQMAATWRLRLDDPVGAHVEALPPAVANVTLSQWLSHSSGLLRDGVRAVSWQDKQPFFGARGEPATRALAADGTPVSLTLGGMEVSPEAALASELEAWPSGSPRPAQP